MSLFIYLQDLMNREKKNKIPSMQVGFIDAVCLQLYEVWCLTKNWKYLKPELFSVVFSSCTFKLRTKFGFSILVKKIFFSYIQYGLSFSWRKDYLSINCMFG